MPCFRPVCHKRPSAATPRPAQDNVFDEAFNRGPKLRQGLRLRWSKDDGFYLENIYRVECMDAAGAPRGMPNAPYGPRPRLYRAPKPLPPPPPFAQTR